MIFVIFIIYEHISMYIIFKKYFCKIHMITFIKNVPANIFSNTIGLLTMGKPRLPTNMN